MPRVQGLVAKDKVCWEWMLGDIEEEHQEQSPSRDLGLEEEHQERSSSRDLSLEEVHGQ